MKAINAALLMLLVLLVAGNAIGGAASSSAGNGEFISLKQDDGSKLRALVAGPADAKAGVLVVHDYLGISDATRQTVKHLGASGYRAIAVDRMSCSFIQVSTMVMPSLSSTPENYNAEAVRATWVLVDHFLASHLKS